MLKLQDESEQLCTSFITTKQNQKQIKFFKKKVRSL